MRIAVVGVGVVGNYLGGKLARGGADVVFLARGATLEALRDHGLQVDTVEGDFLVSPVQATDDPGSIGNLRDITLGHPSELETEVGALVRRAETVGVDVPCHTFFYASLLPHR